MGGAPDAEEVDAFLEQVSEVSILIEGLQKGTISPEYVDKKQELKTQKAAAPKAPLPSPAAKAQELEAGHDESANEEEARKERLMEKVKELQANRERKLKARQKYENYVQANRSQATGAYGTDYTKWDMWCPEDEEDDLFNSLTPNNPAFRTMERDIDERHKRMVEQRQLSERHRVAGNEAFRQGQYSEALRCYQAGTDVQRTNMTLHANAAQAALKLSCYVQAIEHCDKVLHIADFLHNNTRDPLCVKAYLRRATAYRALGQYERAVQDLEQAAGIEPDNKEVTQQLTKARLELAEHQKQKAVRKAATGSSGTAVGAAPGGPLSIDIEKLRRVEQLVQALQAPAKPGEPAPPGQQQQQSHGPALPSRPTKQGEGKSRQSPAVELSSLLQGDDACRVYFRECGGLQAAASLVAAAQQQVQHGQQDRKAAQGSGGVGALADVFSLLAAACINDGNAAQLPKQRDLLPAAMAVLSSKDHPAAHGEAAKMLASLAVHDDVRAHVSRTLLDIGCLPDLLVSHCSSSRAPAQQQVHVLTLLSNCMLDQPGRAALRKALQASSSPALLVDWRQLISSPVAAVSERALSMVSNATEDPQVLACVAQDQALVLAVLAAFITSGQASWSGKEAEASEGQLHQCTAAGSALLNLAGVVPAQDTIANSGKMAHLVSLLKHPSRQVVARLASILARCVKHVAAANLFVQLQGMPALAQLLSSTLDTARGSSSGVGLGTDSSKPSSAATTAVALDKEVAAALDGSVRALTTLVTDDQGGQGAAQVLVSAGGVPLLHATLTLPQLPESVSGNAALCIANLVRHAPLLPAVRAACVVPDADEVATAQEEEESAQEGQGVPDLSQARTCLMAALLRIAYLGQGKAASKNAGIALARLAQDPQLRCRLRQLRGIEIIHAMTARAM